MRQSYLVGGLVQFLGIERGTNAEGDTSAEENVVGDSGDTTVVDLALFSPDTCQYYFPGVYARLTPQQSKTHLGEGRSIKTVLGGDLKTDGAARSLGVPRRLGASLNQRVDLVVVRGGEDAALVGRSDGGSPRGRLKTKGSGVGGDAALLDVVAGRATSDVALVPNDGIDVGSGALEQVAEGAEVEVGLLIVRIELGALLLALGQEGEGALDLEALGDVVGGLDLGLERVQRVPRLGDGEA